MRPIKYLWLCGCVWIALLVACTRASPRPIPPAPTAFASAVTFAPSPTASPPAPPATAAPSPTPAPPTATTQPQVAFTQLTAAGCCAQPFFSPDGERVMFLDKPAATAQTGIYQVPIKQPKSTPALFNTFAGPYNRDMTLGLDLVNGATQIRAAEGSRKWNINNGGRALSFSPDSKKILWGVSEVAGGFDVRKTDLVLANVDGTNPQVVASRFGGGAIAWFEDSARVLIGGKVNRNDKIQRFSVLNLADKSTRDLVELERARGASLSPNDGWVLYFQSQSREEDQNGVYVISVSEPNAKPRKLDVFGAYRWCADDTLLYVPVQMGAPSNELWRINVASGARALLVAASSDSPFKIGNGDWSVFLQGGVARIAFVSARDGSIWLAELGNGCGG